MVNLLRSFDNGVRGRRVEDDEGTSSSSTLLPPDSLLRGLQIAEPLLNDLDHASSGKNHYMVLTSLLRVHQVIDVAGVEQARPAAGALRRRGGQGRPQIFGDFSRSISGRFFSKKRHLHPKVLNQALLRGVPTGPP